MSVLRVALVGNPNAGKTTLFNALTGLRQKVANYPGVTVECREGRLDLGGREAVLLDLPGIYSLSARSPEEQITARVVSGREGPAPDALIVIVDATNLERHLYLACQLMDHGRPLVLALNMMDLARERHIAVDAAALSRGLGIPVVPMSASRGEGLEALREVLAAGTPPPPPRRWRLPAPLEAGLEGLGGALPPGRWLDLLVGREGAAACPPGSLPALEALRARGDWAQEEIRSRYAWIREVCAAAVDRRIERPHGLTERLDRVLTHRVLGLVLFLVLMLLVFQAIFSWARGPMDLIQAGVEASARGAAALFAAAGLGGGALESLATGGVIPGVGSVLVFLPQILCLFFFIALLEDSGYMARAAFLMDRLMRGVGLHGQSFIPLMSSFACAIPGIMATRTIADRKDRLATILVAPLMSCSARLPVYTLMIGAFIPDRRLLGFSLAALTMLSMYLLGLAAAVAMAWLFKRTLLRGPPPPFIMELPPYRVPALRGVLLSMWDRSRLFLRRAGTVILAISILLWFLASAPREEGRPAPVEQSYAGRMGMALEPVIRPLGFDWKIGVGLVTSFAAREVLVSTMATLYRVDQDDSRGLQEALRRDYTALTAVGLMVFFVLACQCMSTVAVVRRETGTWRWPAFMVAYMTALAYGAALAVHQIGTRLAWGTS